jgi:hypothetical protein
MKWKCTRWLWTSWFALFAACSVLVDPNVLSIKCEVTPGMAGEDPCLPAGMHCVASECRPCEDDSSEICNGVDDDCDGYVDEGHDDDKDGFTWCGGGHPDLRDCAPDDAAIHPAGQSSPDHSPIPAPKEACDGKDNDCDSKVDEGANCSGSRLDCSDDGDCSGQLRCDVTTRICIEPRTVGSGCTDDSQCAGGFCLKKGQYELDVELSGNRCASACCVDADCGTGSVCVAGQTGVRVCLPANIAARGTIALGNTCASDNECSSGTCVGGRCAKGCSSDAACDESVCTLSLGSIREARRWSCVSEINSLGREEAGAPCTPIDPTACRSGFCADGTCATACGRNTDCALDSVCVLGTVRAALIGPSSPVSYCVPRSSGDGPRLCCTNSDCGAEKLCAPVSSDGRMWSMACR